MPLAVGRRAEATRRLNGWHRLWIVLTGLGLVAAVTVSLRLAYDYGPSDWEYRANLEIDFANPACQEYSYRPMEALMEPEFRAGGCWYIYTSRLYSETGEIPYTLATYDRDKAAYRIRDFLLAMGILCVAVLFLSALSYLVGWLVNWIRKGFSVP